MAHVRSVQSPLREFTTECSPDMARLRAGTTVVTIRVSKQELANDQIDRSEFLDFVGVGDKHSWTLQLLIAPYAVFLLFVIPAAVVCHWHVAQEQNSHVHCQIGHRNPGRIQNQDKLFYCTVDSTGLK